MLSLSHSLNTPIPLQRWEATHTQELPLLLPIPGGSMLLWSSRIQHPQFMYWCSHSSCQGGPSHWHHSEARKMAKQSLPDIYPSFPDPPIRHQNYGYAVTSTQLHLSMPCTLPYQPETISYSPTWATPSGLLPWDSHQTMTSILVWDTGRPNGDQRHPLVPVGPVVWNTAATCLAAAVTCPHYGPNTTTSLSMGEGYIYSTCKSNQMALITARFSGRSHPAHHGCGMWRFNCHAPSKCGCSHHRESCLWMKWAKCV